MANLLYVPNLLPYHERFGAGLKRRVQLICQTTLIGAAF